MCLKRSQGSTSVWIAYNNASCDTFLAYAAKSLGVRNHEAGYKDFPFVLFKGQGHTHYRPRRPSMVGLVTFQYLWRYLCHGSGQRKLREIDARYTMMPL